MGFFIYVPRTINEIRAIEKPTSGGLLTGEVRFADLAENVQNKFVSLLNSRCRIPFHDNIDVSGSDCRSAVTPDEGYRF
jgi:hypothetical protein